MNESETKQKLAINDAVIVTYKEYRKTKRFLKRVQFVDHNGTAYVTNGDFVLSGEDFPMVKVGRYIRGLFSWKLSTEGF